jgi:hypothetical protein
MLWSNQFWPSCSDSQISTTRHPPPGLGPPAWQIKPSASLGEASSCPRSLRRPLRAAPLQRSAARALRFSFPPGRPRGAASPFTLISGTLVAGGAEAVCSSCVDFSGLTTPNGLRSHRIREHRAPSCVRRCSAEPPGCVKDQVRPGSRQPCRGNAGATHERARVVLSRLMLDPSRLK